MTSVVSVLCMLVIGSLSRCIQAFRLVPQHRSAKSMLAVAAAAAPATTSRIELTPRLRTYLEHKIANTLFKELSVEEQTAFSTSCLDDLIEHVAAQNEESVNINAACNKAMDNLERWIQAKPEEALLLQVKHALCSSLVLINIHALLCNNGC
jgi:hypothetical protein